MFCNSQGDPDPNGDYQRIGDTWSCETDAAPACPFG